MGQFRTDLGRYLPLTFKACSDSIRSSSLQLGHAILFTVRAPPRAGRWFRVPPEPGEMPGLQSFLRAKNTSQRSHQYSSLGASSDDECWANRGVFGKYHCRF